MRNTRAVLAVALAFTLTFWVGGFVIERSASAQAHRIHRSGPNWLLESIGSGTMTPFDMWTTRLANAAFEDRFTDEVIANLDDYQRYGVNTLVVSLQGGSIGSQFHPLVYDAQGALVTTSPVWGNMRRILRETDRRGMVVMVQLWHFVGARRLADNDAVLRATDGAARWLASTGYQHYMYDIVNEFEHPGFGTLTIFDTLTGALQLLAAVRNADPGKMVGISPTNGWFWPAASFNGPTIFGPDIILGHNTTASRYNRGGYKMRVSPPDPGRYPLVNNEFWHAAPSERRAQTNPRTGLKDWGHFDPTDAAFYVQELEKLRKDGGFGGLHSRRQQHVPRGATRPVAGVGPEGTQPEASPGAGEPSLHWLFHEIARLRKFGPLPARHDFDGGYASGFELGLAGPANGGQWRALGGRLVRRSKANQTVARFVGDQGDFVLAFDANLAGASRSKGSLSVQVGAASAALGGYRLQINATSVLLDDGLANARFSRRLPLVRAGWEHFRLVVRDGRLRLFVNGTSALDIADPINATGRNVLVTGAGTDAAIDNVRFSPVRVVDFDDRKTGSWIGATNWQIAGGPRNTPVWRGAASTSTVSSAQLDRRIKNAAFSFSLDLSAPGGVELLQRAENVDTPRPSGYSLALESSGRFALVQLARGKRTPLESGTVTFANAQDIRVSSLLTGSRMIVEIDGNRIIDRVLAGAAPTRGAIALRPTRGVVTVDDFELEIEPNAPPVVLVRGPDRRTAARPLTIEVREPDGLRDLRALKLAVSFDGRFFLDVTPVLTTPAVFTANYDLNRSVATFVGNPAFRIPPAVQNLRITAVDRRGQRTVHTYSMRALR